MNGQERMPLYSALQQHIRENPLSFHVPGHKNGLLFRNKSNAVAMDLTEITGLDDLYHPSGVILESQKLLTSLYGSDESSFLVGGSTLGNLAMIYGTCSEGDVVLVQRNCHKSIIHALLLANVHPVFLEPEYEHDWGIARGITVETLIEGIHHYPMAKALILTYPNYYGLVDAIEELIQIAHANHIPVLVDEAHGAHFIGIDPFPRSAFQLGADVVVQSAHKTLPSLTMGAFIHMKQGFISIPAIKEALSILQTSSPSYLVMASLDYARSYLGTFSDEDLLFWRQYNKNITEQLDSNEKIERFNDPNGDPLKVTIRLKNGESGQLLQKYLEGQRIFPEFSDPANVLLIFPLFKKSHELEANLYLHTLSTALHNLVIQHKQTKRKNRSKNLIRNQRVFAPEIPLFQAKIAKKKWVLIKDALHHLSGGMVIPYPPGIPLLMPGERIEQHHLESLIELIQNNTHMQGDGWNGDHQLLVLA